MGDSSGWVWDKGFWDDWGKGHSKPVGTELLKGCFSLGSQIPEVCRWKEDSFSRDFRARRSKSSSGITPSTAEGPRGDVLLQALPRSHPGLCREAQEQMWCLSPSRAAQHGDVQCREENQGTRLAHDQAVTKQPSINWAWKWEGLGAWRSEVLEQAPAGAVAARSPRRFKWGFMNRFYYVAASNSKGWIDGREGSFQGVLVFAPCFAFSWGILRCPSKDGV